jgi:hypothetical protein
VGVAPAQAVSKTSRDSSDTWRIEPAMAPSDIDEWAQHARTRHRRQFAEMSELKR